MQPSSLEIEFYFVASSQILANPKYSRDKETELNFDALKSEVEVHDVEGESNQWQVHLSVSHQPAEGENAPYNYSLHLIGHFSVRDAVAPEQREKFVKVNGASVLFGIAREHLRVLTSAGPYAPIHLPAVSFVDLIE